jgi:choline-sulfatase
VTRAEQRLNLMARTSQTLLEIMKIAASFLLAMTAILRWRHSLRPWAMEQPSPRGLGPQKGSYGKKTFAQSLRRSPRRLRQSRPLPLISRVYRSGGTTQLAQWYPTPLAIGQASLCITLLFLGLVTAANEGPAQQPNVLFLAVDDMKDWVNCLGGYEGTVHTPNIDRLARRGMLFTNAHCPSPKCAPSRAAIMTGLRPSTTGLYDNGHWWLPNRPQVVTIPVHFRRHGYRVMGAGKIFHHTAGNNPPKQWDDFFRLSFRNDPWFRSVTLNYPWSKSGPNPEGFPFSGVPGLGHENDWGALHIPEADYDDVLSADYAVNCLQTPQHKPFFLACGLFRPHLPWYVPKKYFDLYALDDIVLPKQRKDDLNDLPAEGLKFAQARRQDLERIRDAHKYRQAVRAYLASISFADAQLGRVLDALDASAYAKNTVIVLWSDHGWHLGEKGHWHKSTLWEEATRVPFMIAAPGLAPGRCTRAVSLIDLYPTLNDLCGLSQIESHDGVSLVPLLRDSTREWQRPAVIEYKRGNAAVRSERYRYIRYRNGGEELYDLKQDPHEWDNLASDASYAQIKRELAKSLPQTWAEAAPTKKAFTFDPQTFTWVHKQSGTITRGK